MARKKPGAIEATPHERLAADHTSERIRARLASQRSHSYLRDAVLGGIDGCVTSFAVVAGVAGAGLAVGVALVVGLASLVADGFSMAVSNYQATRSEHELLDQTRREEEHHIDAVPDGERREIREIFASKGFEGEVLERIVDTITANRRLWVDTMLVEEHGLTLELRSPFTAAAATFAAFLAVGAIPLVPLALYVYGSGIAFAASATATAIAFLMIGVIKGRVVGRPPLRAGLETLAMGGGAAVLAYGVGVALKGIPAL